ncbi:PQQ-binding-like beta-propeller repeat protein [Nocardioides marmorisolisilvae]|uniref:YncE family protein n=1 Tax=Nocardioides marmorisolisilvae TaxID=1542737 RepID=A0A3N0DVF0_9ACTN|nr:PQQ-binding-like beta-propeller repeat protein [Nocardioides marmorisolisilvae]RNL79595.1 hypothetical protein EFL95_11515 [Nocardioides marmorisolisilvae]
MRRLIALVVGLLLLAGCGQAATPRAKPWVKVGAGPVGVAATEDGTVWAVGADSSTLARVVSGSRITATLTAAIGSTPLRIAAGENALWVTSFGDGSLLKIDPATAKVLTTTPMGAGAEGVTTGLGFVWVVAQDAGLLLKVRPSDAKVVQRIDVGVGARLVATSADAVWVSQFRTSQVLRIDPATGKVTTSGAVCSSPQGLAPAADKVWVTCTSQDKVVAIDPKTLEVLTTVNVPGQPDPVRIAPDGSVLVGVEDGPTLVTLDPTDGHVLRSKKVGNQPPLDDRANIDLAITDGKAWLSSYRNGRLYRVALP